MYSFDRTLSNLAFTDLDDDTWTNFTSTFDLFTNDYAQAIKQDSELNALLKQYNFELVSRKPNKSTPRRQFAVTNRTTNQVILLVDYKPTKGEHNAKTHLARVKAALQKLPAETTPATTADATPATTTPPKDKLTQFEDKAAKIMASNSDTVIDHLKQVLPLILEITRYQPSTAITEDTGEAKSDEAATPVDSAMTRKDSLVHNLIQWFSSTLNSQPILAWLTYRHDQTCLHLHHLETQFSAERRLPADSMALKSILERTLKHPATDSTKSTWQAFTLSCLAIFSWDELTTICPDFATSALVLTETKTSGAGAGAGGLSQATSDTKSTENNAWEAFLNLWLDPANASHLSENHRFALSKILLADRTAHSLLFADRLADTITFFTSLDEHEDILINALLQQCTTLDWPQLQGLLENTKLSDLQRDTLVTLNASQFPLNTLKWLIESTTDSATALSIWTSQCGGLIATDVSLRHYLHSHQTTLPEDPALQGLRTDIFQPPRPTTPTTTTAKTKPKKPRKFAQLKQRVITLEDCTKLKKTVLAQYKILFNLTAHQTKDKTAEQIENQYLVQPNVRHIKAFIANFTYLSEHCFAKKFAMLAFAKVLIQPISRLEVSLPTPHANAKLPGCLLYQIFESLEFELIIKLVDFLHTLPQQFHPTSHSHIPWLSPCLATKSHALIEALLARGFDPNQPFYFRSDYKKMVTPLEMACQPIRHHITRNLPSDDRRSRTILALLRHGARPQQVFPHNLSGTYITHPDTEPLYIGFNNSLKPALLRALAVDTSKPLLYLGQFGRFYDQKQMVELLQSTQHNAMYGFKFHLS